MAKFGKSTRLKVVGGTLEVNMPGEGADKWLTRIQRFQLRTKDLSGVFGDFGEYMLASIDRNFAAGGRPKWKPLTPAYARYKRRFTSNGILIWSGKMRKGFGYRTTPRTMQITNSSKLFPWHQEGVPQNNLPARPMVILQPRDRGELSRLMREFIYGG